jgi:hypothetical protein
MSEHEATARGDMENDDRRRGIPWRWLAWGVAACLLLLPAIAMQFTDEVNWSVGDFVVFGLLLLGVGVPLELAVRSTGETSYRWAVGVALGAAFLLVWMSLGVGIIGADGDPANRMYFGVLAVGIVGGCIAQFRPRGMAWAMIATAIAQAGVAAIAIFGGLGRPWSGPLELTLLNGFFVALFLGSAWLFRRAAQGRADAGR